VVVGTPGGGIANTSPVTGNYNVNPDGTINIAIDSGPTSVAIPYGIDGTGLPHGAQILRTTTYPDHSVSTGTVSLLAKAPKLYKLASLKGTFAFQANRWTADVSTGAESWAGTINFDGKGHVTGSAFKNDGSSVSSPSLSGNYTMNTNGTGTVSFNSGQVLAFALTNGGKGLYAALTAEPGYSTNYVVTVTATKQ
jgi:hypothetical protein